MLGNIGPMEVGIVLIVVLLVFGPKKLPELGGSLGKGIREFSHSISGHSEEALPAGKPAVGTTPTAKVDEVVVTAAEDRG